MKLFFITGLFLMSASLYAGLNCELECTNPEGRCLGLGFRGRGAALHLNEMLNSAGSSTEILSWEKSRCERTVTFQSGSILSQGKECTEWMHPFPGSPEEDHGARSLINDVIEGKISRVNGKTVITFEGLNRPNFSFVQEGEIQLGGDVVSLSHYKQYNWIHLLIETEDLCFAIE